MALHLDIYDHIATPTLENFSFYKVLRHGRYAIIEMIREFFSDVRKSVLLPEVKLFDKDEIHVYRDFPYGERALPAIVVASSEATELKYYKGVDNFIDYEIVNTSNGKAVAYGLYVGALRYNTVLFYVCESSEHRMLLAELLFQCFTHHYRWQYFYTVDNFTYLSIIPNLETLQIGQDQEVVEKSGVNQLYVGSITMKTQIDYTYSHPIVYPVLGLPNIEVESNVVESVNRVRT